jgi:hypothetical protein
VQLSDAGIVWNIHGSSDTDVWAATSSGAVARLAVDGGWQVTFVAPDSLYDVHAFAPFDVWAGGTGGLFHFDGGSWDQVAAPVLGVGTDYEWGTVKANGVNELVLGGYNQSTSTGAVFRFTRQGH